MTSIAIDVAVVEHQAEIDTVSETRSIKHVATVAHDFVPRVFRLSPMDGVLCDSRGVAAIVEEKRLRVRHVSFGARSPRDGGVAAYLYAITAIAE